MKTTIGIFIAAIMLSNTALPVLADTYPDSTLIRMALDKAKASCGGDYGAVELSRLHGTIAADPYLTVGVRTTYKGIPINGADGKVYITSDGGFPKEAAVICSDVSRIVNLDSIISIDSVRKILLSDTLQTRESIHYYLNASTGAITNRICNLLCQIPPCCPHVEGQVVRSISVAPTLVISGNTLLYSASVEIRPKSTPVTADGPEVQSPPRGSTRPIGALRATFTPGAHAHLFSISGAMLSAREFSDGASFSAAVRALPAGIYLAAFDFGKSGPDRTVFRFMR
jgi:hypothetical protein